MLLRLSLLLLAFGLTACDGGTEEPEELEDSFQATVNGERLRFEEVLPLIAGEGVTLNATHCVGNRRPRNLRIQVFTRFQPRPGTTYTLTNRRDPSPSEASVSIFEIDGDVFESEYSLTNPGGSFVIDTYDTALNRATGRFSGTFLIDGGAAEGRAFPDRLVIERGEFETKFLFPEEVRSNGFPCS